MTTYCLLSDVKSYIKTSESGDDTLINGFITDASKVIDTYCNRVFVAYDDTREYDAVEDVDGRTLILDEDLLSINTVTNGDGTEISAASYVLKPSNETPKYAIKLKASSSESWTYQTDPEEAISINGSWGYANTQPEDIKRACVRLAAWFYDQRDAPFETQGMMETGIVTVPTAIPVDIKALLDPYVRTSIGGI